MRFLLIDRMIECDEERGVGVKQVALSEEYLQDHFEDFPILPGVLMIEAAVTVARHVLEQRIGPPARRHVLRGVKTLKYGSLVRPGETLRMEVSLVKDPGDGDYEFKASGQRLRAGTDEPPTTAISGRFTMGPFRYDPDHDPNPGEAATA